ncbi:unnamed protein product [Vitrella brassicaformis CCMP3155]|uniref:Uncharacterized protein n=1 Tax=Vitrella brassicaformis (strain CCMP3155) TaxID=1169540 RepID=A0A0G4H150_VITBC|nr:unnamed protein product [Vitrella brassicaformis CCMP3155]|eukprot:CEM37277.1 unnamed protein product [Vitrella brassicaformis CCMP3155]
MMVMRRFGLGIILVVGLAAAVQPLLAAQRNYGRRASFVGRSQEIRAANENTASKVASAAMVQLKEEIATTKTAILNLDRQLEWADQRIGRIAKTIKTGNKAGFGDCEVVFSGATSHDTSFQQGARYSKAIFGKCKNQNDVCVVEKIERKSEPFSGSFDDVFIGEGECESAFLRSKCVTQIMPLLSQQGSYCLAANTRVEKGFSDKGQSGVFEATIEDNFHHTTTYLFPGHPNYPQPHGFGGGFNQPGFGFNQPGFNRPGAGFGWQGGRGGGGGFNFHIGF